MDLAAFRTVIGCGLALVTVLGECGNLAAAGDQPAGTAKTVASADGVPVVYQVRGAGSTAIVLVHGWSCDRSYWAAQIEPLARKFQVVTIDLAGHGESGLGREAWTMAAFGADVTAVVRELDLQRVVLVGHSMGGDVIVAAARQLPGRVIGLVWVDAYRSLGTPRTPEQLREFMAPFHADFAATTRGFVRGFFPPDADPSLVDRVATDMSAAPPAVAMAALESALTFDREVPGALEELGLPVVAINPESPATDVEAMARHGVEVTLVSGVGHFLMMEDPESFNRRLTEVVVGFNR